MSRSPSPLRLAVTAAVALLLAIKLIGWLFFSGVAANPIGTASVEGLAVDDLGQPVGGSRLWLMTQDNSGGWSVLADAQGRFKFEHLPAASYALQGYAADHVRSYFTSFRAPWKGTPIDVADGAHVGDFRIVLRRASSLAGTAFGSDGKPLAGHSVRADRIGGGIGPAMGTALTTTDIGGRYQFKELEDGDYIISVRRPKDAGFRLFFPDAATVAGAERATVAPGQQRIGVDLYAPQPSTADIQGALEPEDASPLPPMEVEMFDLDGDPAMVDRHGRTVMTDGNGFFVFHAIPSGRYALFAQITVQPSSPRHYSGVTPVISDGKEPKRVKLVVARGVPVSGYLQRGTLPAAGVTVWLAGVDRDSTRRLGSFVVSAITAGDGGFVLNDVPPGRYTLVATGDDAVVAVEPGVAVTDAVITVATTQVSGVKAHTAKRSAQLTGTVRDAAGNATGSGVVVVMVAAGIAASAPPPIRIYTSLPSTSGRFAIDRLPAGDFDIVAVTNLPPTALTDHATLDKLRGLATRVTITDGDKKTLDLTVR